MSNERHRWYQRILWTVTVVALGCTSGPSQRDKARSTINIAREKVMDIKPGAVVSDAMATIHDLGFSVQDEVPSDGQVSGSMKVDSGLLTSYVLQVNVLIKESKVVEVTTKVFGVGP